MAKKKLTMLIKKVGEGKCLCCGEVTKEDFCDKCVFDAFASKDIWAHLVKTAIRNVIKAEKSRYKFAPYMGGVPQELKEEHIKWYDWVLTTKD